MSRLRLYKMLDVLTSFKWPSLLQLLSCLGLFMLFKLLLNFTEWLRVHYIVNTKVPRGPPVEGVIQGNLGQCTRPDFHRVHEDWTNLYGGIFAWRVLHIHVSTSGYTG